MPTEIIMPPPPKLVSAAAGSPLARGLKRRRVLQLAFWSGIGATLFGGATTIANSLYPRNVKGFGGPVSVPQAAIPAPGAPPRPDYEGHFLLVNLQPGEGVIAGDSDATGGGLLALWWKCPHLGCTVPWKPDYKSPHDELRRTGWFNCNCHGSTYTKAGVRIYGPAPRSMDTMQISPDKSGGITVQTGKRTDGDVDNVLRALPWPPSS